MLTLSEIRDALVRTVVDGGDRVVSMEGDRVVVSVLEAGIVVGKVVVTTGADGTAVGLEGTGGGTVYGVGGVSWVLGFLVGIHAWEVTRVAAVCEVDGGLLCDASPAGEMMLPGGLVPGGENPSDAVVSHFAEAKGVANVSARLLGVAGTVQFYRVRLPPKSRLDAVCVARTSAELHPVHRPAFRILDGV